MYKAKRLHPIASVLQTGKRLRKMIFPLIAFFFSVGKEGIEGLVAFLVISGITVIFTLISGILTWLRYTYQLDNDEVRIEYGIFIRKKRYIPFERIQSINVTEGILQRLFGLVKVQIETAGGEEQAEAVLSAISKQEAELIQQNVAAARGTGKKDGLDDIPAASEIIYKISFSQLLMHSITSSGVGVVFSAALALLSQLDEFIPFEKVMGGVEKWVVNSIMSVVFLILLGLLISWIISLGWTMIKFADFTLEKVDEDVVISHGLLERKKTTIPLKRIQAIRISENLLRQGLGYGTVFIESAGGSITNQEGANVMIIPILKISEIRSIMGSHFPGYTFSHDFTPPPKRAMWRYVLRTWYFGIPIVLLSIIFLKVWGMLSFILLAILTGWAYLKYRAAGWHMKEEQLNIRYRLIDRSTVFIQKNKIQSLDMIESYFQGKRNLATIEVNVKSGAGVTGGSVIDLEREDVQTIYQWFSRNRTSK